MDSFECKRCGQTIGSMQVHSSDECMRQQEINRVNLGGTCQWCGTESNIHKIGCPKNKNTKGWEQPEEKTYYVYTDKHPFKNRPMFPEFK